MLMMQMSVYQVVDMVTVRNSFMPAAWPMNVIRIVTAACVPIGAGGWVRSGHLNSMLFYDARLGLMVHMPVVQEVDMVAMLDCCMSTVGTMNVTMIFMLMTHFVLPSEIVIREFKAAHPALRRELDHWQSKVQCGCRLTGNKCAFPVVVSTRCALPLTV